MIVNYKDVKEIPAPLYKGMLDCTLRWRGTMQSDIRLFRSKWRNAEYRYGVYYYINNNTYCHVSVDYEVISAKSKALEPVKNLVYELKIIGDITPAINITKAALENNITYKDKVNVRGWAMSTNFTPFQHYQVYVKRKYRRQGIATALLDNVTQYSTERKIDRVTVDDKNKEFWQSVAEKNQKVTPWKKNQHSKQ